MKQTANYQLNQWEQADRILMADFNADNLKVDGALAGLQTALSAETAARSGETAALQTAVAGCGNCSVELKQYTGTGEYGSGAARTITFSQKPMLVIVVPRDDHPNHRLIMVRGCTYAITRGESNFRCKVSWSGNSVTWYHTDNADSQMNYLNKVYLCLGLTAKE